MSQGRFYSIFDSTGWIERLVPLSVRLVQFRIKDASYEEVRSYIRRANARRLITFYRGTDFTAWKHLKAGLGVDPLFCDP